MIVITMARKPMPGSVTANIQKWGTGGLNIDATRTDRGGLPSNVLISHIKGCRESECADDCPVASIGQPAEYFVRFPPPGGWDTENVQG